MQISIFKKCNMVLLGGKKSDVDLIEKSLLSYILNKDDMFSLQIRDGARMMAKVFFHC